MFELRSHKLENIGHSDLVIFVCLALVSLFTKHESFMINRTGRRGNYKMKKWLSFEKIWVILTNILCVNLGHMLARYEVAMIKPVARTVH